MSRKWQLSAVFAVLTALVGGLVVGMALSQPALAGGEAKGAVLGYPRYTVIQTEGTNLIVTDNKTNTLYFYTIDPDQDPGADLKLRGTADLNQVGKDLISPTLIRKKQ
jgi:hypothetical protein